MATTAEYLTQLQTDKATLVTNLVAKGVDATNDETFTSLVPKVADISTGGSTEPTFTGSYDRQGLKQIGWTDEEIDYYNQNGVQWNDSEDDYFKLTQTELAGDNSTNTRFIPKNSTKTSFAGYYKLLAIPQLNTSEVTNMGNMFNDCRSLTTIPQLNTSKVTNMGSMFYNCYSLTTIPQLDTSEVTGMRSMFNGCYSLTTIPQLDTSKVTDMSSMFRECYSLKTILLLNTSKVTDMDSVFYGCYSLTTIPLLDTSEVTGMRSMFYDCRSLKTIPQLDTSKVTDMSSMFRSCYSLKTIPQLNTSEVTNISNIFYLCYILSNLGGFQNLGQAYLISQSANYNNYKLDLSYATRLTEQSIINVLNGLYDIATKGCQSQKVVLGSTNLAKLTSEEGQQALSSATEKGWSIS